jgi:hypothetical protein
MNAHQVIEDAAGKFDTPAQAILTRCVQSGVMLRVEGEHLRAKGNRETIAAWKAMIQRHKPEVIAALTGKPSTTEAAANDTATLAADYEELTDCIIKLCQLAGYADNVRERMLAARCNLYPFQYSTECAYFRWQVIRAKDGTYWGGVDFSLDNVELDVKPLSRRVGGGGA